MSKGILAVGIVVIVSGIAGGLLALNIEGNNIKTANKVEEYDGYIDMVMLQNDI